MKCKLFPIVQFLLMLIPLVNLAQEKYWVFFKDKADVSFDPYTYFDQKAIDRRTKNGVSIYSESDKPLNQSYYAAVEQISDSITGHSRWFNAVACVVSDPSQINKIKELPFVSKVGLMRSEVYLTEKVSITKLKEGERLLLEEQTKWLGGQTFKEEGYTGKGVRVCIIDAGFPSVNSADEFQHIRDNDAIKGTWDFHKKKADVYKFNMHGSAVMSCVGGMTSSGVQIGLAPNAEFLLARTELMFKEGLSEEEYWLMAVEWADKNGADIINSSLGYTTSLYFKEDMDGETSLISRAANMAAGKGILVVNAAGNEGDGYWKYVGAPADADSVLTIGGINPWTGIHTSFSSYGPTADMRMKPNISAFAHVIAADGRGGLGEIQGTSFSSPLMAGYAACVIEMYPDLPVMDIYKIIEESGTLYPYFDYAHGYGIPRAENLFTERGEVDDVFSYEYVEDTLVVKITDSYFELNDEVVINYHSRFLPTKQPKSSHIPDQFISDDSSPRMQAPNYVYYHFEKDNVLSEYALVTPRFQEVLKVNALKHKGEILRVWYKGGVLELNVEKPEKEEIQNEGGSDE